MAISGDLYWTAESRDVISTCSRVCGGVGLPLMMVSAMQRSMERTQEGFKRKTYARYKQKLYRHGGRTL